MSETITTTTSTAVSAYAGMNPEDLIEGIKKQSRRARSRGLEMIEAMKIAGHMLLELKARTEHGHFQRNASYSTGLHERTIQRYMEMARGVTPLRTVTPRERITGKGDPLPLIKATEFLPEDAPPKNDTVSFLPVPVPVPVPSPRLPQITVDAEIVEAAQLVDDAPPIPEPGVALVYARTASDALNKIPKRDPSRKAAIQMISDWVNQATSSPAPSLIETSESTFGEILGLLPRLKPEEIAELHRVLESRWMKGGRP
jgi:hypothetical protein